MKLIGIMSLREHREAVREMFRDRGVSIYSETDIVGHSSQTIASFGWFTTPHETPEYGSLAFAIVPDSAADAIYTAIASRQEREPSDHPIRAFIVDVEKMV